MNRFGLIGYPLKNSFSQDYFNNKFRQLELKDHVYQNFPVETPEAIKELLVQFPDVKGFNVTIPHKQTIIPFLNELDESAVATGAVNCIRVSEINGTHFLKGFNTDIYGFEQSLLPLLKPWHLQALVLGTGGAAKAVQYVLKRLGITYHTVSRDAEKGFTYDDLDKHMIRAHQVLINCTPVGMYPNEGDAPLLPYEFVTHKHLAYDLIYLPAETTFLQRCEQQQAIIKNGLEMLHLQADKAWEIWKRN